ncbi:hypothetical protein [Winogradskyella ouciana]|uniref:hypothetical protein n=1 Tax=Winogradskyella ouciana TaxID=2608631 RepID=UPI003D28B663
MKKFTILLLYILFSHMQSYAQIVDSLTVDYFKDSIQNRKVFQLKHKSNVIKFKVFQRYVQYYRDYGPESQNAVYYSDILIENISDDINKDEIKELLTFVAKEIEVEILTAFKDYRAYNIFYQAWTKSPTAEQHLRENSYHINLSDN